MKILLFCCLLLMGCAAKPPKTHTPVPSLGTAKQGIVDSKDYLSKAQRTNDLIDSKLIRLQNHK